MCRKAIGTPVGRSLSNCTCKSKPGWHFAVTRITRAFSVDPSDYLKISVYIPHSWSKEELVGIVEERIERLALGGSKLIGGKFKSPSSCCHADNAILVRHRVV